MLTGPGMVLDELATIFGKSREAVMEGTIKPLNLQK
jgi:hypothetical protein